jgi:hypothetical protein
MKPNADLLTPLAVYEGQYDGYYYVMAGRTDDPSTADIIGNGTSPEEAAMGFVQNLREAMSQKAIVLLLDLSP